MSTDLRNSAWFAGFTDGEGCFLIYIRRDLSPLAYVPRFVIGLRADDVLILEELHQAFGGRMNYRTSGLAGRRCPSYRWDIASKRELAGLVQYFDRFPLRAKKAQDYAIWKRAVHIYCSFGGKDARLPALREALMLGRRFDADEPDLVDPFEVQMALEIG